MNVNASHREAGPLTGQLDLAERIGLSQKGRSLTGRPCLLQRGQVTQRKAGPGPLTERQVPNREAVPLTKRPGHSEEG